MEHILLRRSMRFILPLLFAASVLTASAAQVPIRVPSFGPNGTHWPDMIPTPYLYDETIPHQIEVAPTWTAIANALRAITPEQAAAGAIILVRPGDIEAVAVGSQALQNLGSTTWQRRVTVAPRDGYGTVRFAGRTEFRDLHRICFAGFRIGTLLMRGCRHSALAWINSSGYLGIFGDSEEITDLIEVAEFVQPTHNVQRGDSANFFAVGADITNWRFDGCYHAPHFFNVPYDPPMPHTDTIQFAAIGGGRTLNMHFRDSAYFSSNNCAIQTGNLIGMKVEHCYVASGSISLSRYPHLPGGSTSGTFSAFNGRGGEFEASDSLILGAMTISQVDRARPWLSVVNTTTLNPQPGYINPLEGEWTIDGSLNPNNSGIPPFPTEDFMSNIWSEDAPQRGITTLPDGPTGDEPSTSEIPTINPEPGAFLLSPEISIATVNQETTLYYTLDGTTPPSSPTSIEYTGPFTLPQGVITVTAASSQEGILDSFPTNATYTIANLASGGNGNAWENLSFDELSETFLISWKSVPSINGIDAVVGLSNGLADQYQDLACIVRFNPGGKIDVRRGGQYVAEQEVSYQAGQTYNFTLAVKPSEKTYSVIVSTPEQQNVVIATDYQFRSEQLNIGSIDNIATRILGPGDITVSSIGIFSPTPSPPTGLGQE